MPDFEKMASELYFQKLHGKPAGRLRHLAEALQSTWDAGRSQGLEEAAQRLDAEVYPRIAESVRALKATPGEQK